MRRGLAPTADTVSRYDSEVSTTLSKRRKSQPIMPDIEIVGARTHNLRGIDCRIPAGKLTVITGVSGSGKSSLAFDTLFAEGQRRYVESLSTYARQFVARMPRPDVDRIDHIPPAIALEQKNGVRNARSTVGTATEINDYLRLLFARAGQVICEQTGGEVRRDSPDSALRFLLREAKDARVSIIAPVILKKKALLKATLSELLRQGFTRLVVDGEIEDIDDPSFDSKRLDKRLEVVVDRVAIRAGEKGRLLEALETAYRLGQGRCVVRSREGTEYTFSDELRCASCPGDCGLSFMEASPQLVNFSSPLGACETCQGFGRVTGLDWGKILPDPTLSLEDGVVAPWRGEAGGECLADLRRMAKGLKVRMKVPWEELTERERNLVRDGDGSDWYGIAGFFEWLEGRRYKVQARIQLARYRGYTPCPDCHGHRLRTEATAVRIGKLHIGDVCAMTVSEALVWAGKLKLPRDRAKVAERPLEEVRSRLAYLEKVGLGYLSLARQTRTLSGGESQRINLATSLGSALTDTLYVLDEPTVGLHPRDTARLLDVLRNLRDLGNTIVTVEHDPEVIRAAEFLVDIGPRAGESGGQVVYQGPSDGLSVAKSPDSLTARYIHGTGFNGAPGRDQKKKPSGGERGKYGRRVPNAWITIKGARENNLRSLTARLPLGVLCCVTGVSGSGKSTLIKTCFHENYRRSVKGETNTEPGEVLDLVGLEQLDEIVMVDQSPIGRSSRSNPATYLKAYDHIRTLLGGTPDAKALGLTARDFSFNVVGGRCEACQGTGMQTIDMHFLADVQIVCDVCDGQRFQERILSVEWQDRNINDILNLTIDEAIRVFAAYQRIVSGLIPMQSVGLGYLRLGQSTATLSGGEAQRLKLASHIADISSNKRMMLLFDEPTTGLHPADLDVLIRVFENLVARGFSLVVIEHNLQLIRHADWVIDLGPEGGEAGGEIVCEGTPEEIAAHPESLTGKFLAEEIKTMTQKKGT
ncbi:MAG: excinuclease ABC subunit UvrA [Candidatus Sumerlaeia bacterium]|nr:excinuclease ABC subunit UvrA [Candidatus Sumerlaeia bacterium]